MLISYQNTQELSPTISLATRIQRSSTQHNI